MKINLILVFALFVSCQSNTNLQSSKKEIAKVIFDQQTAWNKGDIEGYMAGYLHSDSLRFASGGNVSFGWETTFKRYLKGYPDKSAMGKLIFSKIDIRLIADDAALVFGKWELDRKNDHPWGLFTLLFNKTENGWRIVHDHTSSAQN